MNIKAKRSGEETRAAMVNFIRNYHDEHGYMPSYKEIGDGIGLKSKSSVFTHMQKLFDDGVLETDIEWYTKVPRAFRLNHAQEVEEIIMKWAKENHVQSNADKFREVFGADVDENCSCIFNCGNNVCSKCKYKDFWNQEYKEPKGSE